MRSERGGEGREESEGRGGEIRRVGRGVVGREGSRGGRIGERRGEQVGGKRSGKEERSVEVHLKVQLSNKYSLYTYVCIASHSIYVYTHCTSGPGHVCVCVCASRATCLPDDMGQEVGLNQNYIR